MKKAYLILFFIICKIVTAQSVADTLNATDATGKRQGKWIILNKMLEKPKQEYKPEQKVEEGKYVDNKKTGKWLEYFPNSVLKSKITYENNRPNGYAIMYHDNGKIREEGLWKNNRWVGEYKLYYENGEVQQEFLFNEAGKRAGPQKYYYENGQIMIEGNWNNGKEAGLVKEYYENGDVKSEKYFNDGNIDASKTKLYEPKKPIADKKTGNDVEVKATPAITVNPVVDKPNQGVFNGEGYHKLFNANKQVSKDGYFSKFKLVDGKVYHYNRDGILTRIAMYKEGKYVGDGVIEEKEQ